MNALFFAVLMYLGWSMWGSATCDHAFDTGVAAGKEEGQVIGMTHGLEQGRLRGFRDGHDTGRHEGINVGFDDGYAKGHEEGFVHGRVKGLEEASLNHVLCFNQGFSAGLEAANISRIIL